MAGQLALKMKIAEDIPFLKKTLDLTSSSGEERSHSLHYIVPIPERGNPDVMAHFLKNYSRTGDLVLDPFAGSGDVALEALLSGRCVFAVDTDPLGLRITASKMYPADITEVTLALQMIDLRRPVELGAYLQYFAPFYDVATFRELVNLRRYVRDHENSRVARFIEAITLGLLHGHGAGFFSVYTGAQISISPADQLALNAKRSQEPDYRATIPRILRRSAVVLRDGLPSSLYQASSESRALLSDPRNLLELQPNSVDLVLTTPPLPNHRLYKSEMWLRRWFAGCSMKEEYPQECESVPQWLDYMNELLLELARVTKGGRRAVFNLSDVRRKDTSLSLDEMLIKMVSQQLGRYWEAECSVEIRQKQPTLKNCLKPRENTRASKKNVAVVLRRR
ncbi:MAG: DNA methyltransferase [Bdellovibrionota bacterium]